MIIITISSVILITYLNSNRLGCNDEKISLEGKFDIIFDKYPIKIIRTSERDYWIYGFKNDEEGIAPGFEINKSVKIEAIFSPMLPAECNIIFRSCKNCQIPAQDVLYDVKVLE